MIENCKIAVWFSCGAASAVAAKKTIEIYGKNNQVIVINNPIKEEHHDNKRFLTDVEKWIGQKIKYCINPKYPDHSCETVWKTKKYMSGVRGAPCTFELKKRARQIWEEENKPDYTVLGFTVDEIKRHQRFIQTERELLPVLIDLKITKEECFKILNQAKIKLPEVYSVGMPNANCIGCVKSSSINYWHLIKTKFPDVFDERAKLSREIGARLIQHNKKRLFLDEMPKEFRKLKIKADYECGIFCEEKF